MSAGRLQLFDERASLRDKRSRLLVRLTDGRELRLREFGTQQRAWAKLLPTDAVDDDESLATLGPEAWPPPPLEEFAGADRQPRHLHPLLRDQRTIAGIGRSWVDEILWTAELSPFRQGNDLDDDAVARLHARHRRAAGRRARALRGGGRRLAARQGADAAAGPPPRRRAVPALRHDDRGGPLQGLRDVLLPEGADGRARAEGPAAVAAAEVSRFARRRGDGDSHAAALELFYDLVFVFAVTQVSHLLLDHLTWEGVGQSTLILLVVWWAWNYTTWVTNELDLESTVVRLMLIAVMLASLLMAVAIPERVRPRCADVRRRLRGDPGRAAHVPHVRGVRPRIDRARARAADPDLVHGVRVSCGSPARWPRARRERRCGSSALVIDYSAPVFVYRVPGRARLDYATWNVSAEHFTERFQLFIIIALGESIILTGATTSDLDRDAADHGRLRARLPGHARRCGGCTSTTPPDRGAAAGARRGPHAPGPRRLHLPARRDGRGHIWSGRSATNW